MTEILPDEKIVKMPKHRSMETWMGGYVTNANNVESLSC